jgi:putative transposase
MLSKNRNESAAKVFFEKAMGSCGLPEKMTIDKSDANKVELDKMNLLFLWGCFYFQIKIKQIKYLNNMIEQDHRGIKKIIKPIMGFKAFYSAKSTLAGIELWRRLKKISIFTLTILLCLNNFINCL